MPPWGAQIIAPGLYFLICSIRIAATVADVFRSLDPKLIYVCVGAFVAWIPEKTLLVILGSSVRCNPEVAGASTAEGMGGVVDGSAWWLRCLVTIVSFMFPMFAVSEIAHGSKVVGATLFTDRTLVRLVFCGVLVCRCTAADPLGICVWVLLVTQIHCSNTWCCRVLSAMVSVGILPGHSFELRTCFAVLGFWAPLFPPIGSRKRTSSRLREFVQKNMVEFRARSGDSVLKKLRMGNPDGTSNKEEKRWYSWMRDKDRTDKEKADMEALNGLVTYSSQAMDRNIFVQKADYRNTLRTLFSTSGGHEQVIDAETSMYVDHMFRRVTSISLFHGQSVLQKLPSSNTYRQKSLAFRALQLAHQSCGGTWEEAAEMFWAALRQCPRGRRGEGRRRGEARFPAEHVIDSFETVSPRKARRVAEAGGGDERVGGSGSLLETAAAGDVQACAGATVTSADTD